jgi:hypothetical protein
VRALVSALRTAYRVEGASPSFATSTPPPAEPVRLGEERTDARTREVFLALRPDRALLAAFLEARERATRGTLLLVPTARALGAEVGTRYAAGAHVEVEVLEDAIAEKGGTLSRVTRLRLVSPVPEPDEEIAVTKPGGIAAQLGATSFADLGMKAIDGHTVRITHSRKRLHATYIDLGLATKTRNPSAEWGLLLDVCAGHGKFRWKKYGSMTNAKQRVSVLQAKLRAAFGLDDNPFHKFRAVDGWRARFFASSEVEERERGG